MKKPAYLSFIVFVLISIVITSCKEIPPFIDKSEPIVLATDTTYVLSPVPDAQDQNILIEDISGVRCVNCPDAAKVAHNIYDKNPDRIVVLTLHSSNFANFTSPYNDLDLRTEEATNIVNNLGTGTISGLPIGMINRKVYDNTTTSFYAMGTWNGYVEQEFAQKSKANLLLELFKDEEQRKATLNITTEFTQAITSAVDLTIVLSESHIVGKQESRNGILEDYEHNFILRETVTNYSGLELMNGVEAGRVFEKGFEIDIPEEYIYENCSFVVVVTNRGTKEVLQVAEVEL